MIIGLDLDGVCYHWDRTARYMLRRRIIDRGDFPPVALSRPADNWDSIQGFVSEEDWAWLWSEGVTAGLYRYGHVVGGAIEGVQALNRMGDVVAITARPKAAVHDTLVWLSMMFDQAPLSGLVIQSHGQKKSDVTPVPDIYIDDGIHNADDILDRTQSAVVLFDQPWNQGYTGGPSLLRETRLFRAHGWGEVVDIVSKFEVNNA